jgi:hypothetical protein
MGTANTTNRDQNYLLKTKSASWVKKKKILIDSQNPHLV